MNRTKTKTNTKLTLNRETIRELADSTLSHVVGGAIDVAKLPRSGGTHCKTTGM
jgi:hypothetical protein